MAQLQEYYWILKDEVEDDYKCAANAHDTVPKLYRTEGYARAAATNAELQYGHGWTPVKVRIQMVHSTSVRECGSKVNGVCQLHNIHCAYPDCES